MKTLALHACALGLAFGVAEAQAPTAWTVLPVPGGVVPNNLRQIGKVVTYSEPGQVQAYSAFAHRFVSIPTSGSASLRVANDLALVVDGATFHAFSAYTGDWATVVLGPAATVVNPSGQQNDSIWLVRDGADVWSFTAFGGTWVRQALPATGTLHVERHVALAVDGSSLHALSAYDGRWVTAQATGPVVALRARGTAAVATTATTVHGFSALRNTWTFTTTPGANATLTAHDDVQVVADSGNLVAFSGLRGSFAGIQLGTATVMLGEALAYATDGNGRHEAFSAVRGAWVSLPGDATASVTVGNHSLLVAMPDRVHAFSSPTGTVATALVAPNVTFLARSVAALQGQDNSVWFYSALRGQWVVAPAGAHSPEVSDVAGFARTANGIAAFSARQGTFFHQAMSNAASTILAVGNSVQAAIDGASLHVFDARRGRWLSETLQGTPQVAVHRTTLLVIDGNQAFGYGAFSGQLTATSLPGTGSVVRPNSESGSVEVTNALYVHSSVPDLLTPYQFPEFRRAYVAGAPLEVQVQATTGAGFLFLGLRTLQTPIPIAGLGDLELDPAGLLMAQGVLLPISQSHATVRLPVPDVRTLRGLELGFQAVVVPVAAAPYLTQSTTVSIF